MVTSMPPADPWPWAVGDGEVGEELGRLEDDADCTAVVREALVVEAAGAPELEQPTTANAVAAPISVAARLEGVFIMPSGDSRLRPSAGLSVALVESYPYGC
jgi:hypothetical protein